MPLLQMGSQHVSCYFTSVMLRGPMRAHTSLPRQHTKLQPDPSSDSLSFV